MAIRGMLTVPGKLPFQEIAPPMVTDVETVEIASLSFNKISILFYEYIGN